MSDNVAERQLNLLFLLLNSAQPVEREEIRRRIPAYLGKTDEAFERMFERDKTSLRDLGVSIETVSTDGFHEDAHGYVVSRDQWQLPELNLTSSERSLLNLAAAAWQEAQISESLNAAVHKLGSITAQQPNFRLDVAKQGAQVSAVLSAKSSNVCVTFRYLSVNSDSEDDRLVAPWRIFSTAGQTYLIGFDQNKGEQRVFRFSRITSAIQITTEAIIEQAPSDLSAAAIVEHWKNRAEETIDAQLELLPQSGGSLRLMANSIELGTDSDRIHISGMNLTQLAKEIARQCYAVKVLSPASLKNKVEEFVNASGVL